MYTENENNIGLPTQKLLLENKIEETEDQYDEMQNFMYELKDEISKIHDTDDFYMKRQLEIYEDQYDAVNDELEKLDAKISSMKYKLELIEETLNGSIVWD